MHTEMNVGRDLVTIHRVVTRALQVSLLHCREAQVTEAGHTGFTAYLRSLASLLHAHHLGEDEIAFPFWKTRLPDGPFDQLMDQHQQMIPFLDRMDNWTKSGVLASQEQGLHELHNSLAGLQDLWLSHIALEEQTVGPDQSARVLSLSENAELSGKMSEHGQAHSQPPELVMPFIIYNLSGSDRQAFLALLPPVVKDQLVPTVWKPAWEPMIPFLLMEG